MAGAWAYAFVSAVRLFTKFFAGGLVLALVAAAALLLSPKHVVGKLPRPLPELRLRVQGWWKRAKKLSSEGPFYTLMVYLGKRFGYGNLASRPGAPKISAESEGAKEIKVTITPFRYRNPFHEENYLVSWHKKSEPGRWRSKEFHAKFDCEQKGKHYTTILEGLPEHTDCVIRAGAVNLWGQSDWSNQVMAMTLVLPSDDGGYTGPLGAAMPPEAEYTWTQTQTEIIARVPLDGKLQARDIKFKCAGPALSIHIDQEVVGEGKPTEVLSGPLCMRVKADDVFWTIEEKDQKLGRHLMVQLVKADGLEKWSRLIEADGHPRIDTRHLKFFSNDMNLAGLGDLSKLR